MARPNVKPKSRRTPNKVTPIRDADPDVNQLAHHLVKMSTEGVADEPSDDEVHRVMAALGRRGGKIGGKARAASMSPERRRAIALKAARARWNRK